MKIVHICAIGTITEGLTYQDNLLPKYHVKSGHAATIITHCYTREKDQYVKLAEGSSVNQDGVKVIRLGLSQGKDNLSRFKRLAHLYETIEAEQPDVMFVHGCQFLDVDVLCRYKRKHPTVKMYVDNHADFTNSATSKLSYEILHKIIWRNCAHKLVPYTEKFYGVLPARVDFLRDVYKLPSEKVSLLVMGADDAEVQRAKENGSREKIRARYGVRSGDILITTGGRIDSHKFQIAQMMEIVHQLSNPRLHLIVFGGVSDELKARVEASNHGNVHYIGWSNASESYTYFEAADIAIFPGRHSVFWEQVTGQGKPMIVRKWPGTDHVDLHGNVEFLQSDDPEELKQKLKELLEKKDKLQKMTEVAVENGMKVFSYADIARRSIL